MTFAFLLSLLGFSFALRIARFIRERDLLTNEELTKIGTAYLASVLLLVIALPRTRVTLWLAQFVPLALLAIALTWLLCRRSRDFRERFREMLTHLILKMKSGRSFRQSLAETISESDLRSRTKLSEIANVVVFSQQRTRVASDAFVREVIEEFHRVDRAPHSAIQRLVVFRDKLRLEDDFRRRSGQVLAQLRAQSFVMTGLYLAVLSFVIHQFGWRANARFIVASAALFTAGAAWIWIGGRRIRWKV